MTTPHKPAAGSFREYKIHDDGCDELLVDGFCHRCQFAPDMQSTAWVSAYPSRDSLRRLVQLREDQLRFLQAQLRTERVETELIGALRAEVAELRKARP